jgi:hypothetical protein
MMTEQEISAIEARANVATPGPWMQLGSGIYGPKHPRSNHPDGRIFVAGVSGGSNRTDKLLDCGSDSTGMPGGFADDSHFIAEARTDIPALIAEVRELKTALGKITAQRDILVQELSESDTCPFTYKGDAEEIPYCDIADGVQELSAYVKGMCTGDPIRCWTKFAEVRT